MGNGFNICGACDFAQERKHEVVIKREENKIDSNGNNVIINNNINLNSNDNREFNNNLKIDNQKEMIKKEEKEEKEEKKIIKKEKIEKEEIKEIKEMIKKETIDEEEGKNKKNIEEIKISIHEDPIFNSTEPTNTKNRRISKKEIDNENFIELLYASP